MGIVAKEETLIFFYFSVFGFLPSRGLLIKEKICSSGFFSSPEPKAPGGAYSIGRLFCPSVVCPQFGKNKLEINYMN